MDYGQLQKLRRFMLLLTACLVCIPICLGIYQNSRPRVRPASALSHAKQLNLGVFTALQDNHNRFPDLHDPHKTLWPYIKNEAIFYSPRSKSAFVFDATLSGKPLGNLASPEKRFVFYEALPDSEPSRVVGFADGRARLVSQYDWEHRSATGMVERTEATASSQSLQNYLPGLWFLSIVVLCLGAAHTVAQEFTGWQRVEKFVGHSLFYLLIFLIPALLWPVFAQWREAARMV
jgi:hypothetical protein